MYLPARFRGRPATRFRVKGCLDAESDGVAIRRADGAFCRNRYNVARGTQSGHPASNRLVHWHHWSLRCGLSALPGGSPHAGRHQRAGCSDSFRAGSALRRSGRPRRSVRRAQRHTDRDCQSRYQPDSRAGHDSASHIRFDRERPTGKLSRPARRRAPGNFPKLVCLGFCRQTRGNHQRTYRLGARSRFYCRADRLPHSPTSWYTRFPCWDRHPEVSLCLPAGSCLQPEKSKSTGTYCSSYS